MIFEMEETKVRGELVPLTVKGKDVYNPTGTFEWRGKTLMAARVEDRSTETGSRALFFTLVEGRWKPLENNRGFAMQDPFIAKIDEQLVLGGVEVDGENGTYRTVFYIGQDIDKLEHLIYGPVGMKDIRLVQLQNGKIGVFTRPQGEKGGRGKIGFTVVDNLNKLNLTAMEGAELIENQFREGQWGGVNQAILLENGRIGILGHVAEFEADEGKRYSAMTFVFDPASRRSTPMCVIVTREDFPETQAKKKDLKHVVFPGGIVLKEGGLADIYVGLSDTSVGVIRLSNPWN